MTTASFYINQIPNNIDEIVQSLLHHHYHLQIYFNSPLHHHLTNHHVPHSWHETVNFSNEINQLKNHHSIIIAEAYEELNEDTVEKVSFLRVLAGNYKQNAVFIDSKDILNYLQAGATTAERKKLSVKAFSYFSKYDAKLAQEIERNDALIGKRVLVIGSGGREHAIVWKIASSDKVSKVFTAPGNSGTERENSKCENVAISAENIAALVDFSVQNQIDFVFVGPEQPLVDGIVDALTAKGIPAFGPNQKAAIIEASKAWSKDFMARNNIRTARYRNFTNFAEAKAYIESLDYRVVVKASGLAAGKGVLIPTNTKEAVEGAKAILEDKTFGSAGSELVVEEFLEGEEISLLAFSDGTTAKGMPAAQDHKRVFDNDQGLNTGGMGAYAPSPLITPKQYQECLDIVRRSVTAMAAEGRPFVGVLYAGFIVTPKYGPVVLEYNCRFGDPETQVLLPLLKSDLFDIVSACVNGKLKDQTVEWNEGSACTVVCAAPGYPESYPKGATISGLQNAASLKQVKVFHAGAKSSGNNVVTNGGRVLAVSGTGSNLKQAVDVAYSGVKTISFDGIHYRTDIARRGLNKKLRIGVLGSTRGTALQPVIDAINAGQLHAEIALIISNKSSAGILERAKNHNIPSLFISAVGKSREEYDTLVANAFDAEGVDLVLMIGYMRIVSKLFCDRFAFRCLNVHPSLLPDFAGGMDLEVHAAVIAAKKKVSGCTVHFVTEQVDGGPIAVQLTCAVEENDTLETLKARVQLLEGKAFLQAIEQFKEGKFDHLAKETITYRAAGVDIDAGEELVERIKPFCKATRRTGCDAELGGFGGLFDLAQAGYDSNETILVSGTDGVGTKLKIAQATGKHRTIGIDLVAMCVNDVVVCGAEPLFFLDYYATGALNVDEAADVIEGIAEGCAQSGSALIGGETAEMAGMYAKGEYDLAGFSVGAVRRSQILPRNIFPGDVLIGLPSSGVHSNGYSLVRKCVEKSGVGWHDPVPFPSNEKTLADALLIPTKIYVKELLPYIKQERIKGLAHITGGGLLDNLPRVLPEDITAVVNFETNGWTLPPVFQWLQSIANLPQNEILRTFNCGIGMILVVGKEDAEVVLRELQQLPSLYFNNTGPIIIGHLQTKEDPKQAQVTVIGNIH